MKNSRGVFTTYDVDPVTGLWLPLHSHENQTQAQWGYIAAMALGRGNADYRIRAFLLEFENVGSPGDAVTAPTEVPEDEGIEYFLSLSGNRDYLRVPVTGLAEIDLADGSPAEAFPEGGNRITLHAVTAGTVGAHGLPFASESNSKVFGVAVVAAPFWDDPTRDVVFARSYYAANQQVSKSAGRQLAFSWKHSFAY